MWKDRCSYFNGWEWMPWSSLLWLLVSSSLPLCKVSIGICPKTTWYIFLPLYSELSFWRLAYLLGQQGSKFGIRGGWWLRLVVKLRRMSVLRIRIFMAREKTCRMLLCLAWWTDHAFTIPFYLSCPNKVLTSFDCFGGNFFFFWVYFCRLISLREYCKTCCTRRGGALWRLFCLRLCFGVYSPVFFTWRIFTSGFNMKFCHGGLLRCVHKLAALIFLQHRLPFVLYRSGMKWQQS